MSAESPAWDPRERAAIGARHHLAAAIHSALARRQAKVEELAKAVRRMGVSERRLECILAGLAVHVDLAEIAAICTALGADLVFEIRPPEVTP